MRHNATRTIPALLVIIAAIGFAPAAQAQEAPHDRPGPAADTVYFRSFDVDRAPRDLEAGRMDLYMYSLKTDAANRLEETGDFRLYQSPASTVSLLLNPAPAPEGRLNPFSMGKIRRAMQYLVNREFIANQIYRGMAVPMVTHVSPFEFDYLTVFDIARGAGYGYDPEYARQQIRDAMQSAGAERVDGTWTYEGQPVRVRIIGRVEDERRNIADLIRSELQKAGFQVNISYRPFAAAIISVYASDPQSLEWHVYTEGWSRGSPQRYDYATINQMYAPWLGNMPGWREVGYWQYENDKLDNLGKELFRGEFASLEERNTIYRQMTRIGLHESVRIWLATVINSFPARQQLEGVTRDVVAGPRSPWTAREAHVPGSDELTIGHLWVWTERTTWNPVGGFGDVYSVDIWRNLHDPPIWNHPFTGIPQPMRVEYDVRTAGPDSKLNVPRDAVMWDAAEDSWDPVGSGVRATSRVVLDYSKYFGSTWHHDRPITMADVWYSIAQSYELAYDEDKYRIETALGVTSRPFLETFRGFRLLDENRIAVYVDYWHFDPNYIASYASPAGLSMPWELLAAMDNLVFEQRRAAYSDTAASRFNVTWLSLVMRQDARLVDRALDRFIDRGFVPEGYFEVGNTSLVSSSEAEARYRAAREWFDEKEHMVISNGPYLLERYDPPAQFAELRAFRKESYPFRPGDWAFGSPPDLRITGVGSVQMERGEETQIDVRVQGPGELGLEYLLLDPATGDVIASGDADSAAGRGAFTVSFSEQLTSQLFPGLYRLSLAAHSDASAVIEERTVDVDVER